MHTDRCGITSGQKCHAKGSRKETEMQGSAIKSTNALYFLSMSTNPTYVSAAIEPSSGVQGHVHINIH
jgi:hypothetical protein